MFKVSLYTQKTHPIVWERPYANVEALKMLIAATSRKLPNTRGLMVVIPRPKSKLLLMMGGHFTKSSHYLGGNFRVKFKQERKKRNLLRISSH